MVDNLKIKGITYIFLVPAILTIMTVVFLVFPILNISNFLIIDFYSISIYITRLSVKNRYSDAEVVDKIVIPNAPTEIDELLKKKTRTYRLINVNLIDVLGKRKKLSQSDLVDEMKKRRIELSQPAIEKYLSELEAAGIVESKKAYKKEYHLTDKGKWCYLAVDKCFPNRYFFFVVRHYLGRRKLPPYP
jgi:hypothetical protein